MSGPDWWVDRIPRSVKRDYDLEKTPRRYRRCLTQRLQSGSTERMDPQKERTLSQAPWLPLGGSTSAFSRHLFSWFSPQSAKALRETAVMSKRPHPMTMVWPEKADPLMSLLFSDHVPQTGRGREFLLTGYSVSSQNPPGSKGI